jgi:hypothetical protein
MEELGNFGEFGFGEKAEYLMHTKDWHVMLLEFSVYLFNVLIGDFIEGGQEQFYPLDTGLLE